MSPTPAWSPWPRRPTLPAATLCALGFLAAHVAPLQAAPRVAPPESAAILARLLDLGDGGADGWRTGDIAIRQGEITANFTGPTGELQLRLTPPGELPAPLTRTEQFDVAVTASPPGPLPSVLPRLLAQLSARESGFAWLTLPERTAPPPELPRPPTPTTARPPPPPPPPTSDLLSPLDLAVLLAALLVLAVLISAVVLRRLRRKILFSLALFAVLALAIRVPRIDGQSADTHVAFDPELGWGPVQPPDEPPLGQHPHRQVGQRAETPDPTRRHLLAVGDSVALGHGLAAHETFVHQMGQRLHTVQTLNLSVTGYAPDQEYLYAARVAPSLRPAGILLFVFVGNDVPGVASGNFYGHFKPQLHVVDGELARLNPNVGPRNCPNWLADSLALRPFWLAATWQKPSGERDRMNAFVDALCGLRRLDRQETTAVLAAIFQKTAELAVRSGGFFTVVLLPTSGILATGPASQHLLDPAHMADWRLLREVVAAGKHELIDVRDLILRNPQFCTETAPGEVTCDGQRLMPDGGHWSAAASAWLGQALADELRRRHGIE